MQTNKDTWASKFKETEDYKTLKENPVAYFSAEYALSPTLPIYAGGLGILAGDIVKESAEQDLPIVFIGLLYKKGQNDIITNNSESNKEIKIISVKESPVVISIPISGRQIYFQIWHWNENGANVYLLDTDVEQNTAEDRLITEQLYVEDRELRLKQEILLGIGGFRFLRHLLGLHPSVYHLNEGHSAFLALELVNHEMIHQRVDFSTACSYASKHILFTNHTLVAAGQEIFAVDSIAKALDGYAKEICVTTDEIISMGITDDPKLFSMTMFSFRFSSIANSVSILHGKEAQNVWPEYKMDNITNGIYIPRWDKISDSINIWGLHQENKKKLLQYIKEETGELWDENTLLFGWGRRMVPYKQPLAFIQDVERFVALAQNSDKPFRIVFSGPTNNVHHNELLAQLKNIISEKLSGVAVFLPHYNIDIATLMVAGCDVWLNTPEIGREACGTSGMKAALNGVLPFSTKDGWIAEVDVNDCGWVLNESENLSKKMLDITEEEILPMYYSHILDQGNSKWLSRMKNSRSLIEEHFSTNRVMKEYTDKCYIPILNNKHDHKYK
ncbi:MAG: alpha-glucan family phosphorylase [Candidatus Pacebacteria bacterium]|nr:alpha-glucan family phosphorylase [Candidatus Paceibacterota bacterium]